MVLNSSNSSTEGGNTNSPSSSKQISPAVRWCFTLNNYTEDEVSSIVPVIKDKCKIACCGYEEGESGTPHIQGYIEFKTKCRPLGLFDCKRIHWEKAKGTKQQNIDYCSKEGKLFLSLGMPKPIKIIKELLPFQQEICDMLMTEPDDRTIYWYWNAEGNIGKTQLMKYLCVKHKALPCVGGKFGDIMNLVFNQDMDETNIVVFNVPRGHREKMSYSSLEAIKDGLIVNTKFETGYKVFNSPHVIVFANFPPDTSNLSADRWVIKDLGI